MDVLVFLEYIYHRKVILKKYCCFYCCSNMCWSWKWGYIKGVGDLMEVLLYVDPERRVHKSVADSMAVLLRIDPGTEIHEKCSCFYDHSNMH